MSWLEDNFEKIQNRDYNIKKQYIRKWQPLLDSKRYEFKLDSKIFDIMLESVAEFVDIFVEIDGMRPEISTLNPYQLTPNFYEPEGWIDREDVINMFFINLKNYENKNKNINLEIEKEYFNILTGKVTYLLKTDSGLKMDYVVKKEYDEKYISDIKDIIELTELFILNPEKRSQIERKMKIQRLLNV